MLKHPWAESIESESVIYSFRYPNNIICYCHRVHPFDVVNFWWAFNSDLYWPQKTQTIFWGSGGYSSFDDPDCQLVLALWVRLSVGLGGPLHIHGVDSISMKPFWSDPSWYICSLTLTMTFSYFYIASLLFVALRIGDFQFNRRIRRIRRAQGNKTSHCQRCWTAVDEVWTCARWGG